MKIYYLLAILSFLWTTPFVAQEKKVSLIFAGDAMQHLAQIQAAKTDSSYNYAPVFKLIKDKISNADIAGINLETTLGGKPYKGFPKFSSPDQFAEALHNTGFDIFFTANNHTLDTGQEGLERTIKTIKDFGAKQTGTFVSEEQRNLNYPLMIIKNGIRIAFLNYTYGTNGLLVEEPNIVNKIDTNLIRKDIAAAHLLKPDIMIAVMHWGVEYQTRPSKKQKAISQFLMDNGVRIIIGHHPHVVQPKQIQQENNTIKQAVYYSLGNFVSNQRRINRDGGMMAEITLTKPNKNGPVIIESADHSLVWVRRYYKEGKLAYQILPVYNNQSADNGDNSTADNKYKLQPYEQAAMNRFIKSAERILKE